MYLDKSRAALRIDQKGELWPLKLKAMVVPLSDDIYVTRNSWLVPNASAR